MNNHFMDASNIFSFTHILLFLLLLIQSQEGAGDPELYYQSCGKTYTCGEAITNIKYPFRGINDPRYCGYPSLVLSCNDQTNTTSIEIASMTYTVLEINPSAQTMVIARQDVAEEGLSCPQEMANTTLDQTLFEYNTTEYTYITFLYDCPGINIPTSSYVSCGNRFRNVRVLPGNYGPGDCNRSVVVPVSVDVVSEGYVNTTGLDRALRLGFEIRYNVSDETKCGDCVESNGRCGVDLRTNQTTCFCAGPPYVSDTCPVVGLSSPPVESPAREKKLSQTRKDRLRRGRDTALYIAGGVVACVMLGWLIFYIKQRKNQRAASAQTSNKEIRAIPSSKKALISPNSTSFSSITPPSSTSSRSNLGRSSSYFGVHVFDYTELERATDNFDSSRELGDGGFGTVYYGLLPDGREVAIKLLYEHNFRRVEQFMNEIKILTKLSHENLVKLHGCTSRRSRELILVYEYVPNGTVADHLHGKLATPNHSTTLPWPTRLSIAIETARALAYLHKSDIIHRDVKTNNILLDKDFHVKVADFGLSRLFPCDATHVSTAPQGTPGYVDPEYYQCYKVTEKSDVYSFGVVLVELLSSLQAVDVSRSRSDINLYNMAMSRIQGRKMHELFDTRLGFETDGDVRRMMTDVGELAFRCLQQEGEMRPSMRQVLESLVRIRNRDDLDGVCKVEIVDMWIDEEDFGVVKDAVASSPSSDSTPLNPAY